MEQSISKLVAKGFKTAIKNYFRLLLISASYNLIIVGPILLFVYSLSLLKQSQDIASAAIPTLSAALLIIMLVLLPGLTIGKTKAILLAAANKPYSLVNCYISGLKNGRFVDAWGFFLVYVLGLGLSALFFVLPAIYLYIIWFMALFALVDKDLSVLNSFAYSKSLVKKISFSRVLGLGISVGLIKIAIEIFLILAFIALSVMVTSNDTWVPFIEEAGAYIFTYFTAPFGYMICAHLYLSLANEPVEIEPQKKMNIA